MAEIILSIFFGACALALAIVALAVFAVIAGSYIESLFKNPVETILTTIAIVVFLVCAYFIGHALVFPIGE